MHRSSKQRRQKLARRWKRALFAAMCAASFATSAFSFGEELAPARKKLPTRPVTPVALTREAASEPAAPALKPTTVAPAARPEDSKVSAPSKSALPRKPSAASPKSKLLGAKTSIFRPIAIEVTPEGTTENAPKATEPAPLKISSALPALPKPEVKAKLIPSRLPIVVENKPVENAPEEAPAPIVSAASLGRPAQKLVELKPTQEKPIEENAEKAETNLAAAPLSPWMQDIRSTQAELKPLAKVETPAVPKPSAPATPVFEAPAPKPSAPAVAVSEAPAPMVAATPIAAEPIAASVPERPVRLPTPFAPSTLPTKLTIFERAAIPAYPETPEAEVTAAQVVEGEVPTLEEKQPAEFVPPQEPAPIVAAPIVSAPVVSSPKPVMVVNEAPEPKLLVLPSKPLRQKVPTKSEVKVQAKSETEADPAPQPNFKLKAKAEPLVLAVQNDQPAEKNAADPLPGPDKDKDLKKHFEVIQQTGEFSVQVHRSKLLRTAKDIYRTAVVDDAVLEIVQFTPREISLIGRSQGTTHVTFWFDDPATQPVTYLVTVEPDAGQVAIEEKKYQMLEDMINEMFPDSKIHMQLIANKLVVRGQARDSEEAFQIMTLIRAQGMGMGGGGMGGGIGGVGGGGFGFGGINEGQAADPLQDSATGAARRTNYQIINMLRVPGVQQVALRVKIAELNRTAGRNFGINLQGRVDLSAAENGSKILLNSVLGNGGKTAPAVLANFDGDDISVGLSVLSEAGVIRLLSEPTLVTLSGNPATFIAGGEFAVPTIVGSAGLNAVTTDFRAFGAIISFLPTVVDKDRIRLQVAPEFSQVNTGLTVNGTPGLKVRAATTTVEMREGQTLAIAGLLEDNMNATTAGDIPFLAKLLGKRTVNRNETELIILVTPELVHPMEPEEVPPLPGFDVTEPTNKQFYFHGDIEGNPTMNYRSTVWPRLRQRYKAGGPAMTSGPFGHGQ